MPPASSEVIFYLPYFTLLYFTKGIDMFDDLKESFENLLDNCSHISTSQGVHIVFPEKLFSEFEQEFKICFVEPEDDLEHQLWVENDDVV